LVWVLFCIGGSLGVGGDGGGGSAVGEKFNRIIRFSADTFLPLFFVRFQRKILDCFFSFFSRVLSFCFQKGSFWSFLPINF
jgi:hypothetical protein